MLGHELLFQFAATNEHGERRHLQDRSMASKWIPRPRPILAGVERRKGRKTSVLR